MATTNENESLIDLLEQDVFDTFFTAAVDTAAAPPVAEVNMGGVTGSELLRATSPAWELGGAEFDALFMQAWEKE